LITPGSFEEVKMSIRKSSKPKKIESPEGEIVDSVAVNLGDDKFSHDIGAGQATSTSGGVAWSPESGKRNRWVGWNDWDSVRDI
jgi:hypothetical protein